jgi:general secretion pathway protein J
MSAAPSRPGPGWAAGCTEARDRSRGFTLLELLVAITVLSIVSLIAWRGLDTLVATRDRLEPEAADVRALLATFGQMERDLAQVPNPKFLGLTQSPVSLSVADGATVLQLARIAPSTSDRPTEVQTVYYRVVEGMLTRQATAALPAFQAIPTERLESARLLGKVRTLYVRTWSPNGSWVDPNVPQDTGGGAPAAATAVAPGLEVTIERTDGKTFRRVMLVGA